MKIVTEIVTVLCLVGTIFWFLSLIENRSLKREMTSLKQENAELKRSNEALEKQLDFNADIIGKSRSIIKQRIHDEDGGGGVPPPKLSRYALKVGDEFPWDKMVLKHGSMKPSIRLKGKADDLSGILDSAKGVVTFTSGSVSYTNQYTYTFPVDTSIHVEGYMITEINGTVYRH